MLLKVINRVINNEDAEKHAKNAVIVLMGKQECMGSRVPGLASNRERGHISKIMREHRCRKVNCCVDGNLLKSFSDFSLFYHSYRFR